MIRSRIRCWTGFIVLAAMAASIAIGSAPQGVDSVVHAAVTSDAAPAYQWPEFHDTSNLDGVSADPAIDASNAGQLGVKWMSPIGDAWGSPAVAYSAILNETLAYVGTQAGYFDAVNVANGQIVWSDPMGSSVTSSPLVEGGNVWIAPSTGGRTYKLNAATGAVECSAAVTSTILSTPVIATPPGGSSTVYFASLGNGPTNGNVWAFSEADCSLDWSWNDFNTSGQDSGVWDELSYGVDATGEGLLLFGSANPDSSVYALDAETGAEVWRFQTYQPTGQDWDVGAGITVSAPGVNGFADGVAYTDGKDGIFYALDLTTGAMIWEYNFGGNGPGVTPVTTDALTTPALSQTTLTFGAIGGEWALNAITGKLQWQYSVPQEDFNSSPAIVGPQGGQVSVIGGLDGNVDVVSLESGSLLYSYTTGAAITSSPADVDGNLIIASEDGFLYDFGLGGGNGSVPTTTVTSPVAGATVTNPDGPVTIAGTATSPDGVSAVDVEVQTPPGTGPWLNATSGTFAPGVSINQATLSDPGTDTTGWSIPVPTTLAGGSYQVLAFAVGTNGIADPSAESGAANQADVSFSVGADPSAPQITLSVQRAEPGGSAYLTGSGFGSDEKVTVDFRVSAAVTKQILSITTSKSGTIKSSSITVPVTAQFGPATITATGATSGLVGSTQIYVSNNSDQVGYNAGHTGFELDDGVLSANHSTIPSDFLTRSWVFSAAGAIDTTPAISNGVIYVGDESGDVYAVTSTTGEQVWSTNLGSAVKTSPAVDSGQVFFGDAAGQITSLDTTTGATNWSTSLGSKITPALTVADGLVYASTVAGTIYAINETTGVVAWSRKVSDGPLSSPAVDTSDDLVFVGDNTGNVDALSLTSGAPVWSTPIGGAVVATPAVGDGKVFVGSNSGSFFALSESNGSASWSDTTDAAITAGANIGPSYVVVGSTDGNIYSYSLANGAVINVESVGHPIAGIVSATAISIATTTAGGLAMYRTPYGVHETWRFFTSSNSFSSPGIILNGEFFASGKDGELQAFAIPGRPLY